jgi:hypothetical protein
MSKFRFTIIAIVVGTALGYIKLNLNLFSIIHNILNAIGYSMQRHHDIMEVSILFLILVLSGLVLDRVYDNNRRKNELNHSKKLMEIRKQSNQELVHLTEEMVAILNKFVVSADRLSPNCVTKIDSIMIDMSDRVVDVQRKLNSFKSESIY